MALVFAENPRSSGVLNFSSARSTVSVPGIAEASAAQALAGTASNVYISPRRLFAIARERLTANRTYYVSATGNDSNTGLTAADPLLTIGAAVTIVQNNLDLAAFSVTISVADGTYGGSQGVTLGDAVGLNPPGGSSVTHRLRITGNTATPGNVILNPTVTAFNAVATNTTWLVEGFKFSVGGGAGAYAIEADYGSKVYFNACTFNSAGGGYYLVALYGGKIESLGNFTISGSIANGFILAGQAGHVLFTAGKTCTLTGTPNFGTAFAVSQTNALVTVAGITFSGSATGTRYIIATGGGIDSNGGGTSFLPGNAAGSTTSPGWYN